jgi:Tripartite tricarboxylate transporter TctB family
LAFRIRHRKDFFAGLIFVVVGVFALVIGRDYSLGSATRMGPGYFPALLGWLLVAFGAIIGARSIWIDGPGLGHIGYRPLLLIIAAMVAFAMLLETAGLVTALLALIVVGGFASTESRIREVAPLSIALIVVALGLFVYGLGLPLKLWPIG